MDRSLLEEVIAAYWLRVAGGGWWWVVRCGKCIESSIGAEERVPASFRFKFQKMSRGGVDLPPGGVWIYCDPSRKVKLKGLR